MHEKGITEDSDDRLLSLVCPKQTNFIKDFNTNFVNRKSRHYFTEPWVSLRQFV